MNEITKDELRNRIKDEMDLCTKKRFNLLSKLTFALVIAAIGYIYYYWQTIINSVFDILAICFSFIILLYPIFQLMYWYEERDYYRTEPPKLSTFFISPFIHHHLLHITIYATSIFYLTIFAKFTIWPFILYGMAILIFESQQAYKKKKEKKDILHISAKVSFPFIVSTIIISFFFISFIKAASLEVHIKTAAIFCVLFLLIYHLIYDFWLSPNRRLYAKLIICQNRLNARGEIDLPEEYTYFLKTIKGYTFSELFEEKINLLSRSYEFIEIKQEKLLNEIKKFDFLSTEQKYKEIIKTKKVVKEIKSLYEESANLYISISTSIHQHIDYLSNTSDQDKQEAKKILESLEDVKNKNYDYIQNFDSILSLVLQKGKEYLKEVSKYSCRFSPIKDLIGEKWCYRCSNYPRWIQSIFIKLCSIIIKVKIYFNSHQN